MARIVFFLALFALSACQQTQKLQQSGAQETLQVEFEQFTLDNGLNVIFHIDRSDPVVAVVLTSHVGSAREKMGRTGFAHLFEHLLFLESENLGKGGLDKMSARIGGSGANGSTSRDRTNYYQTVPNDALEKMIWAEADKLGYFINTVTAPVLEKEKQVVKNEKRQGVDNQPYGHTNYVIDRNLYPPNHPYHWQVIGSLEDLQNATLQDVKDFYNQWYVPNNVTLVIAGDFDTKQAKTWVEKYFSEIKSGATIERQPKQAITLETSKKLYYEDNFAQLPALTLTYPSVYQYHPDSYPLQVLTTYLSEGKQAPMYQVLVEDKQLTSSISMYNYTSELAGQLMLNVQAYEGKTLDEVYEAIQQSFNKFERDGISEEDLARIIAQQETAFYNGLSSVLGKGFQLAQYQIFANDPNFINQDIENILAVTKEDVKRVYEKYIKGKPFIATSFIPKNRKHTMLSGSVLAEVIEEKIVEGAEQVFVLSDEVAYERTPSSFDRTIEPPYGKTPEITIPPIWEKTLDSGMKVFGIENTELPLVQFSFVLDGGMQIESLETIGVANLIARVLPKGTETKTPAELEKAFDLLGASISINATSDAINVQGSCLARNYPQTMALVQEILLQPRWDEKEFILAKQSTLSQLKQQASNPNSIATNQFRKLIYGDNHLLANSILGTESSVDKITMQDLKAFYHNNFSPSITSFHIVGDISEMQVLESLANLEKNWNSKPVTIPNLTIPNPPQKSVIYFYDVPGAKQSVLQLGNPALAATDADYYPATVMNYILGGGGFASQLTQELREGKGYTYGIRSEFTGSKTNGYFTISSGVRSNVTLESVSLIKEILENYAKTYSENDLEVTKSFLIKSNARRFETLNAKLNMLVQMSQYDLPYTYMKDREQIVQHMTVEKIKELAQKYIRPNAMYYLVVGDAKTQLEKLKEVGFGDPILLNEE